MHASKDVIKCIECGFRICKLFSIPFLKTKVALCSVCAKSIPSQENPYLKIAGISEKPIKRGGRPAVKFTPELVNRAIELRKAGMTYASIAKELGLGNGNVYARLRREFR